MLRRWLLPLLLLQTLVWAKPRTNKDWSKMTDKDWDAIEKEWETPEEKEEYEYKPPKQQGIDIDQLTKSMKNTKDPKKVQA